MTNLQKPTDRSFHVQDVQVWKEIFYLDSPTDYREYLPKEKVTANLSADMVMLEERSPSRRRSRGPVWPLFVIALVILVSSGYLVYAFLDAL